jgi:hypothetical protein
MTFHKHLVAACALVAMAYSSAAAATLPPPTSTTRFTDGSVATTYEHCGDADVCAVVAYPDHTKLTVYSEGAALCQPYFLHFVQVDGKGRTAFEYSRAVNHEIGNSGGIGSRCGNSLTTQMVMDHGYIHMTVNENADGTLTITFSQTGKR